MIGSVDGPALHTAVNTLILEKVKDAEMLSDLISRFIKKAGAENVIFVVTDNAANGVKAGLCSMKCMQLCALHNTILSDQRAYPL
jgi:hypothetical protein